jgi:hypothetical protein
MLGAINLGQMTQAPGHVLVLGSEGFLPDDQGSLKQRYGRCVLMPAEIQLSIT